MLCSLQQREAGYKQKSRRERSPACLIQVCLGSTFGHVPQTFLSQIAQTALLSTNSATRDTPMAGSGTERATHSSTRLGSVCTRISALYQDLSAVKASSSPLTLQAARLHVRNAALPLQQLLLTLAPVITKLTRRIFDCHFLLTTFKAGTPRFQMSFASC